MKKIHHNLALILLATSAFASPSDANSGKRSPSSILADDELQMGSMVAIKHSENFEYFCDTTSDDPNPVKVRIWLDDNFNLEANSVLQKENLRFAQSWPGMVSVAGTAGIQLKVLRLDRGRCLETCLLMELGTVDGDNKPAIMKAEFREKGGKFALTVDLNKKREVISCFRNEIE